jgi:hypothetical protein
LEGEPLGQLLPSGGIKDKIVIPARLFCKSVIINISSFDHYLSIPTFQKGEVKVKTISNVFRMWKHETPEDIKTIIANDLTGGFDASLFMKDPNDIQTAIEIIIFNFKMI